MIAITMTALFLHMVHVSRCILLIVAQFVTTALAENEELNGHSCIVSLSAWPGKEASQSSDPEKTPLKSWETECRYAILNRRSANVETDATVKKG